MLLSKISKRFCFVIFFTLAALDAKAFDFDIYESWLAENQFAFEPIRKQVQQMHDLEAQVENEYKNSSAKFDTNQPNKEVLQLPSYVLKKRILQNRYKECLVWFFANILSLDKYVPLTWLVGYQGCPITLQAKVDFHVSGHPIYIHPSSVNVNLLDFWFANILAHILVGLDNQGANIGFRTTCFAPVFFDSEDWLRPPEKSHFHICPNSDKKTGFDFSFPFWTALFKEPQFSSPLSVQDSIEIKKWQENVLSSSLSLLESFLSSCRDITPEVKKAVLERAILWQQIEVYPGLSFASLLPQIIPGLPSSYYAKFNRIYEIGNLDSIGVAMCEGFYQHLSFFKNQQLVEEIKVVLNELYQDYNSEQTEFKEHSL
ncbi:MAG: hypothetical protein KR126chlam3_00170 [Chlamydiae bacterium]|nr:hypothetical protein [Chlamydiota bacterium]